jgi:hypothetical protein
VKGGKAGRIRKVEDGKKWEGENDEVIIPTNQPLIRPQ